MGFFNVIKGLMKVMASAAFTVFCKAWMLRVACGILPALFFVSPSDTLFCFTFVHKVKVNKSKFLILNFEHSFERCNLFSKIVVCRLLSRSFSD